jgi:hypothetical protein
MLRTARLPPSARAGALAVQFPGARPRSTALRLADTQHRLRAVVSHRFGRSSRVLGGRVTPVQTSAHRTEAHAVLATLGDDGGGVLIRPGQGNIGREQVPWHPPQRGHHGRRQFPPEFLARPEHRYDVLNHGVAQFEGGQCLGVVLAGLRHTGADQPLAVLVLRHDQQPPFWWSPQRPDHGADQTEAWRNAVPARECAPLRPDSAPLGKGRRPRRRTAPGSSCRLPRRESTRPPASRGLFHGSLRPRRPLGPARPALLTG